MASKGISKTFCFFLVAAALFIAPRPANAGGSVEIAEWVLARLGIVWETTAVDSYAIGSYAASDAMGSYAASNRNALRALRAFSEKSGEVDTISGINEFDDPLRVLRPSSQLRMRELLKEFNEQLPSRDAPLPLSHSNTTTKLNILKSGKFADVSAGTERNTTLWQYAKSNEQSNVPASRTAGETGESIADLMGDDLTGTVEQKAGKPPVTFALLNGKLKIAELKTFKYVGLEGGEINVYFWGAAGGASVYYCRKNECSYVLRALLQETELGKYTEIEKEIEKEKDARMKEESDKGTPK
jgi:hypothetical protein